MQSNNYHSRKPLDPRGGLRFFLLLDALLRAWIWGLAVALTAWIIWRWDWWPRIDFAERPVRTFFDLAGTLSGHVLLFNAVYVVVLTALRLPIPTPREGRYTLRPGEIPNWNVVASCLCAILTKARAHAPFPGFLVFNLANLPPFVWVMGPIFGPRSRSCYVVDPILLDPHLTTIGRNVTFGYGTIVAAHSQERDAIIVKRTVIEDDVLFGGNVIVYGGCTIGRGAVILGGAVVQPDTVIGENELWGGLPAKKIKDLPAYEERTSAEETTTADRADHSPVAPDGE